MGIGWKDKSKDDSTASSETPAAIPTIDEITVAEAVDSLLGPATEKRKQVSISFSLTPGLLEIIEKLVPSLFATKAELGRVALREYLNEHHSDSL